MGRKETKSIIETVEFVYVGSDKQFNNFMKAVIRDYVSDDKIIPESKQKEIVKKVKTA